MKKVFEPATKSNKDFSEEVTKTMTEISIKNNKTLENLNNKLLEIMNDRGITASYLLSPISKVTNPKNSSQFKQVKEPNSNRVYDLIINKTIPVTLENSLLTFRETVNKIELHADF